MHTTNTDDYSASDPDSIPITLEQVVRFADGLHGTLVEVAVYGPGGDITSIVRSPLDRVDVERSGDSLESLTLGGEDWYSVIYADRAKACYMHPTGHYAEIAESTGRYVYLSRYCRAQDAA